MASDGPSRQNKGIAEPFRRAQPRQLKRAALAVALLCVMPSAAIAADGPRIAIPAEPLDRALMRLARQIGFDIISTEPGLAKVRSHKVDGQMSASEALRRLLDGTGYRAVAVDGRSYRIVRAPRPLFRPRRVPHAPREPVGGDDIIVTASKQNSTLLRFPGSAILIGGFAPGRKTARSVDMDDITRATPVLQNTDLGVGRNKIFIRGIADSSFNGATQSTASLYFDEVPLGFAGPEPSLNLYDIKSMEVLEGPQGTLYGSGAIGGIIRVTPNSVDLGHSAGSFTSGVTATADGGPGFDVAGMANVPLVSDRVGLRLVGYRTRAGGFIDDRQRKLSDVNVTDTVGGRGTLAIDPGDGWSVEIGGLYQRITAADAQYAERNAGPLTRRSLAQPYSSEIGLIRGVVRKHWDSGLELISATGYVDLASADTFDATRATAGKIPTLYINEQSNTLFVQEMRLSRAVAGHIGWLVGAAVLHDRNIQARALGPPDQPLDIIGVTNMTDSLSAFGEVSWPVSERLTLTGGARVTSARTDGEPSVRPRNNSFIKGRATHRVDPTLGLSWLVAERTAVFARVQSGYRTGGLAVATGVGRVLDFRSDSIGVAEVGIRKQRTGPTGLELTTALSYARWRNIQADLYNMRGQPYTANIGNAEIFGIEATGDWAIGDGLHANFALLYTYNVVDGPLAQSSVKANRRLPETPAFAGNVGFGYRWTHGAHSTFNAGVSGRYVGRSVLGTGDFLDVSQGNYGVLDAQLGWHWRNLDVSLSGDNLANARANRFALGNPTILSARQQTTPLRPRNVRLGFSIEW